MPALSDPPLLHIDCGYGHRHALGRLQLEVAPGEIVVVTGPNGAGKSTLMSTIAGEIEPVEGEVRVSGTVDPAAPEGAGAVTFLADPSFFPDLTIGEHLEMTAHHVGVPADELRDSVERWQVADIESELPSRVSSGQRQRAYLALQLASAADVVVLDEPERHLDGDWVRRLGDALADVGAGGAAVVVATHSTHLAGRADRTVQL
ncbi:MAG: ATP-binding cassette domain-containing protein [Corynebacterium sp.]|uniref:ABC transporter ATP-binding protein n=2 Tax=Corynebacteriaceae TaxID=1653 RepID=UPI00264A1176|nr:ATP-binding cassette domain-containing protein [Corynebacterium sp.]MDN6282926.1 ATP-binding cassette domain-containing protein [Corynebacterium sp.]MDN6305179.1 ATP-binding cassette domain-containing protein [Corynebacterium sp.]MDN6353507.1 ATP-binding cassette domain-containing protein [Corynebacterium sp.]MDN6367387.1 ATP-binding cassette domain-containing protein [Corynebacterium sp.]MDN6376183.1 ATP-binding cassette domain-containing protein [Corynebacterium sp.]